VAIQNDFDCDELPEQAHQRDYYFYLWVERFWKVVQECVSSWLEQSRKPYPPRSRRRAFCLCRRAFCLCRRFALLSSTFRDWLVEVSILSRPNYSACSYLHAEGIEWRVRYRVERLLRAFLGSTTRQKYEITWIPFIYNWAQATQQMSCIRVRGRLGQVSKYRTIHHIAMLLVCHNTLYIISYSWFCWICPLWTIISSLFSLIIIFWLISKQWVCLPAQTFLTPQFCTLQTET